MIKSTLKIKEKTLEIIEIINFTLKKCKINSPEYYYFTSLKAIINNRVLSLLEVKEKDNEYTLVKHFQVYLINHQEEWQNIASGSSIDIYYESDTHYKGIESSKSSWVIIEKENCQKINETI